MSFLLHFILMFSTNPQNHLLITRPVSLSNWFFFTVSNPKLTLCNLSSVSDKSCFFSCSIFSKSDILSDWASIWSDKTCTCNWRLSFSYWIFLKRSSRSPDWKMIKLINYYKLKKICTSIKFFRYYESVLQLFFFINSF